MRGVQRAVGGLLLVLTVLIASPAHGEALTPLQTTTLPALDAARPLLSIDRNLLAFGSDGAVRRLAPDAKGWTSIAWSGTSVAGPIVGTFGNGREGFVLVADTGVVDGAQPTVVAIERIAIDGDVLLHTSLPPLPATLQSVQGTVRDGVVHVAGRVAGVSANTLWRIDTAASDARWSEVALFATGAALTSLVAQNTGIVATAPTGDAAGDALWRWTGDGGWQLRGNAPGRILPGSGLAIGQAHVLYLVQTASGTGVMTFQSITNAWATLPGATPINPFASFAWTDGVAWAATDVDGGVSITSAQVQARKLLLTWLDWIVIVVYLASMIGIGLYFYLRDKRGSTETFFVGDRTIPFWAAGLSLYAVNTSSISFIAIPAKAFETNWQYLTNNLVAVMGLMFVAVWVVPLLRRLDLMSTFSYLETRFHPGIRMMASALAIVMQIGSRMSVILFLPALAIATITGISVVWSVIMMGGFTIIYTAMGGMKAVIWTDVVQVIVKMGGAIFAIGFIVWSLNLGVGGFLAEAMVENKMKLLDFSFDLTKATVWGFIFLVIFEVVLTFPKDQVLMQRVLSTKSDKDAGRSIWAFAAIMIPGGFVFYMIGTALFLYYRANPERMNPLLPIDATFPLFIAAELPMGVTGLIIAGIFAAAMATLSGIMNSVATLISVDFYDRFAKNKTQKKSVFFAEMMTVLVGLVGIAAALVLSRFDVHSLFDVSIELAGLLGGGFAGAYTLGMFTRRANSPGVAIGIAGSIVLTSIAWSMSLVHPYFYLAISILACIVIGYVASLFFPAPRRSLEGLTIYGSRKDVGT